jgi:hypothetical protein
MTETDQPQIKLTDEHIKHFPAWKERYIQYQLRTGRFDKKVVAEKLRDLYFLQGYEEPSRIIFVPNPFLASMGGMLGITATQLIREGCDPELVLGSLQQVCLDRISGSREIANWLNFDVCVTEECFPVARRLANLDDVEVGDPFCLYTERFTEDLKKSSQYYNGGNTWAYKHAHLTFFRDVMGASIPHAQAFDIYAYLNENSGPRLMFDDFVVVSEFPTQLRWIKRGDEYLSHNTEGPSFEYSDGFCIHHLDNIPIPGHIFAMRHDLDLDDLNSLSDAARDACIRHFSIKESK